MADNWVQCFHCQAAWVDNAREAHIVTCPQCRRDGIVGFSQELYQFERTTR